MAYIGKTPVLGNFIKLDAITTSSTASYTMNYAGSPYSPQSVNHMLVSLNGVIQAPTSAYTVSGSTITFSDSLTSSDTIDFIMIYGNVLDIGTPSDGTITAAKLAGGISGLISWQSVQTTGFTAVAGRGYPCNTTSSAFTVTLPASPSVGDQVQILDYAGTFDTNNLTVNPNSNKLEGGTNNLILSGDREGVTLTYIDSTQGWLASSGIQEGTDALAPVTYSADFLVIAGGASGGSTDAAGGGGAGGYRSSNATYGSSGGGASAESSLTLSQGAVYTITVGAGGAVPSPNAKGGTGGNSSISGTGITTITSLGGGGGAGAGGTQTPASGGSGGGGADETATNTGASGTANQGYAGGNGAGTNAGYNGGGGGGAGSVGGNASGSSGGTGGNGGSGVASTITGSSVTRAGGAGGNAYNGTVGTGGSGGGGNGSRRQATIVNGTAGTANTGGGGGGGVSGVTSAAAYAGGSGVVILRMLTSRYSGTTSGSPTVSTSGSDTILTYTGSGSYTA